MQNARYQPLKDGGRGNNAKQIFRLSWTELVSNWPWQLERNPKALGARRTNFPRREVDFTKDIVKSPTRQCKWRPTSEMSNATLFKHSEDENDDFAHCWRAFDMSNKYYLLTYLLTYFSLFDEIIFSSYRRTLKLTFPNAFPGNCVPICRWDRVSTTYITRDIDDQSFRTVIRLSTQRWVLPNEWRTLSLVCT